MDEHRLLKRLLSQLRCSNCGHRYEPENIRILGHQRELWFMGLHCPSCNSQGLVAAVVDQGGIPEVVSDLSDKEWAARKDKEPVSADEVLDVHEFLEGFSGDFAAIFSGLKKT